MYLNKSIATLDEIADSAKNANLANPHSPRKSAILNSNLRENHRICGKNMSAAEFAILQSGEARCLQTEFKGNLIQMAA
jgi:hypothetical protein